MSQRVVLIIPSLKAGGMERVMAELADFISSYHDYETHIIIYGADRQMFYNLLPDIVIHKPDFKFNPKLRFLFSIRTLLYLRTQVKKLKPVTILSFGEYWNSFVLLALYGFNFPVYISDRCSPDKTFSVMHSILRKLLYPGADGIITQTSCAKEIYFNMFKHSNIRVIPNPVRLISLSESGVIKENIILSVGRLIETKHHDKLIEMFNKISLPGWKLVIVGGNALNQDRMSYLRDLITQLRAEKTVFLTGEKSDVKKYYLRSKIFALTSSSEGFPNVILEAMTAGLPVISFDCMAGPSEIIIDEETGYLIPLLDWQKYEDTLRNLMGNKELTIKMGRNGQKVAEKYSIEKIGDKYLSFITGEDC